MAKPNRDGSFQGEQHSSNVPGPEQPLEKLDKMRSTHPENERDASVTGLSPCGK